MNNIVDFFVMDRKIYFNISSGTFSFFKFECQNDGYIDYNQSIDSFKPSFINICLSIGNTCNLNCDYCFNHDKNGVGMKKEIAVDVINIMIDKFPDCGKYFVDLSGYGEPLLFLNTILEINNYCKRKSNEINREILVSFVTNGTLLTKSISNILQNNGILFGVSLDGNEYVHDKHRKDKSGSGTYSQIIENILKIENRDYVGCAITISDEIFDLESTICELLNYFKTICIKPIRENEMHIPFFDVDSWIKQYDKLTARIIADLGKNNIRIIKALLNGEDYFGKFIYRCFMGGVYINRCDAGITRYSFNEKGECFGCPSLSINKNNRIYEIEEYKQRYRKQIFRTNEICGCCQFKLLCGGECEIEISKNNGKCAKMCRYKQELIKRAMLIKLTCETEYYNLYNEITNFCFEKRMRFKKDVKLDAFLEENKYEFVEGKRIYDAKEKHY